MTNNDAVLAFPDGYFAFVNGHLYGPWNCKEYAQAGLQTEQRRAQRRAGTFAKDYEEAFGLRVKGRLKNEPDEANR